MTAILLKTHTMECDGIPMDEWSVTHNGADVGIIFRRTYLKNCYSTHPIFRFAVYTYDSIHVCTEFIGLWRSHQRALAALRRRVRGAAV